MMKSINEATAQNCFADVENVKEREVINHQKEPWSSQEIVSNNSQMA
jgi:hypothetical protein